MIVAMGVLTTGLLGVMTLVSANLNASRQSAERFVGLSLAEEAVESARAIRDGNWLAGQAWNVGLVGAGSDRTATLLLDTGTGERTFDFGASALSDDSAKVFGDSAVGDPESGLMRQFTRGAASLPYVATAYRRLVSLFPICLDATGSETVVEGDNATCPPGSEEIGTDVRADVSWAEKGTARSILAEEKLYDWR